MHECLLLTKNLYVGLLLCKWVSVQKCFSDIENERKRRREQFTVENIPFRDHSLVMVKGLHNSMNLWATQCRATQGGCVIVKSSDKIRSTRVGNGKPLHENSINSHTLRDDGGQMGLACLRSLGLQRVGHGLVTEQQQQWQCFWPRYLGGSLHILPLQMWFWLWRVFAATLCCSAWASHCSHCGGFFCCGAQALGRLGFSCCGTQVQ